MWTVPLCTRHNNALENVRALSQIEYVERFTANFKGHYEIYEAGAGFYSVRPL